MDASLEPSDIRPDPDVITQEIMEYLETELAQFRQGILCYFSILVKAGLIILTRRRALLLILSDIINPSRQSTP